jgi:hypothetical protein
MKISFVVGAALALGLAFAMPSLAQVVPLPDSGTADAGVASKAIANVAANDTINGAPAILGTGGNATIARYGTWPTGLVLNTTSGALTTTAALAPGVYSVSYKLSDLNGNFATTIDTVTVITAVISPMPDSGTADFGVGSQPIANVAANDSINGAPATLGTGGNAKVSQGTNPVWPSGIVLNTSTGTVSTSTTLPVGVYSIVYNLCDLNVPATCNSATDTVSVAVSNVVAVAESGNADAGTGSQAIANVVANDTINGATPILGASGTAVIKQSTNPVWPSGIVLNTSTGAVTTSASLAAGSYSIPYMLCDKNTPAKCSTANDSVTVITPVIVANPDSGTAIAGIASKPVTNVTANDTVNGAPVTLGSTGNATISPSGTWPSGISLTPSTGAISTTSALLPGVYTLIYNLCDRNSPPVCVPGTVTITVNAAVVALPIAGSAIVGTSGTPIGYVPMQDLVNTAPVVLGGTPNATLSIAPGSTWPSGFSLDPVAGAINSSPSVPVGTYSLPYQLCDLNSPPDCATAVATVAITAPYSEVSATTTPMGDVEFDWGRDGVHCPTCNFGDGNDRANWTDRSGNIWIAHLDPDTGVFVSPGANDELADTTAYFWNTWGNGPEWAFSTHNGQVISQLVYSRWQPGQPAQPQPGAGYAGAAYTTQTAYNAFGQANWTPRFLPGAIGDGNGTQGTANSNLPEASQCNTDALALVMYKNFASPLQLFTEDVTSASGTTPELVPIPAGVVSNGIGERFVPCTQQVTFQAQAPYGTSGQTVQQVFWYNLATGAVEQITTDPTSKYSAFMFKAPDFGGNYILFTLANHTTIQVFEQTGANGDGSPQFTLVNSIVSPDPNEIYLNTMEPFISCTPTCTTYAFTTLCKTSTCANGITEPNGLAVVALSPETPLFNILVQAASFPARQRLDPEYYITPNGPLLYYNRIVPESGSTRYNNEGEFFINMQLGIPSGNCVGSSAEGGLSPNWPSC